MPNSNTRITSDMSTLNILLTMSEGNPEAITCMTLMMESDPIGAILDILFFDMIGIYGSKIYTLWNDCCGRSLKKLKDTVQAFREGKFSEEEIFERLSQPHPTSFI